ncbi:DNA polymerase [archaeon]|jgi:hypothetical protein|nr:DNA polymerase [archaeon]|tara:strand:+ start:2533 stop:2910 length:378 start_codon:yes stop_codon:yes gene_type:complete
MKLGEYLNAINHSKKPLMDTEDEQAEKQYNSFIINRCLSYFIDTVLHSNLMNQYHEISTKMQFDYLSSSIRKRKRFSKWLKQETDNNLEIIKEYFQYSNTKAKEICDILTEEEIEEIKQYLHHGG